MKQSLLAQGLSISGSSIRGPLDPDLVTISDVINRVLLFLIPLAAIVLFFVLVWGGYDLMTSGGVPDKIKGAQAKITSGIIGFVLLITAFILVKLIAYIFGFNDGIL